MDQERRGNLAIGTLLLLVGAWFLAIQFFPDFAELVRLEYDWPVWVIGVGAVFLLVAALTRIPGFAIPAAIIAGVGGILYYQNATGDWASWAYAWTLFPGFVGVGTFIMNVMEGKFREAVSEGFGLIFLSLVLFAIFGSFLGGINLLGDYSAYWPVLLILAGGWMLIRSFWKR